jgi:pimeloyl-ACP methyl ester carboxylesterase
MKFYSILLLSLNLLFFNQSLSQEAIQVKTRGEGQAILFLPGFANSYEVWEETLEHLVNNYQFHMVDYAGFNGLQSVETPWLPKVKKGLQDYIVDNELKDLIIIGHSLGGTLAIYLAGELQDQVQQIIIVDGLPNTSKLLFPNQKNGSFSYDNPYANAQLNMPTEQFKQMLNQQVQMMCKNKEKHELITEWMVNTDRATYVKGFIDYLNFDATPYLEKIEAKVLILGATSYGRAQSEQVYKNQYANLAEYDIKFAENSAHYVMYDQPEWYYQQINQALTDE